MVLKKIFSQSPSHFMNRKRGEINENAKVTKRKKRGKTVDLHIQ